MGKIKGIIFDVDGVLVDARDWHYECLNEALSLFGMEIDRGEHLAVFDGLPTRKKLEILSQKRELPRALHPFINELKQIYTLTAISRFCRPNFNHEFALSRLKQEGYRLAVASNSIRKSVEVMMEKANLTQYFDFLLSNEDVKNPKPDPEIYTTAISKLGFQPQECLIVEDNDYGLQAARGSGGHVLLVDSVEEVNFDNIVQTIRSIEDDAC